MFYALDCRHLIPDCGNCNSEDGCTDCVPGFSLIDGKCHSMLILYIFIKYTLEVLSLTINGDDVKIHYPFPLELNLKHNIFHI